ncbi:MAG: hypothetical protein ACP5GX_07920 [Anaerolineae bacterium]
MVLEYWKRPVGYARLMALLGIQDFGAPSFNIQRTCISMIPPLIGLLNLFRAATFFWPGWSLTTTML